MQVNALQGEKEGGEEGARANEKHGERGDSDKNGKGEGGNGIEKRDKKRRDILYNDS